MPGHEQTGNHFHPVCWPSGWWVVASHEISPSASIAQARRPDAFAQARQERLPLPVLDLCCRLSVQGDEVCPLLAYSENFTVTWAGRASCPASVAGGRVGFGKVVATGRHLHACAGRLLLSPEGSKYRHGNGIDANAAFRGTCQGVARKLRCSDQSRLLAGDTFSGAEKRTSREKV